MRRIPRRIFMAEFKREAIKLATEQGLTMVEASRKLDIEVFYNRIRRHAKIGNQVPADFANQFYAGRQQSAA